MNPGTLGIRVGENDRDVGRNPGEQVPAVALQVTRVLPIERLLDGLKHQSGPVGHAADRRLPRQSGAGRAVANGRTSHMRAVAGIEIGRSVVSTRIADVAGEVRCDRIARHRLHSPSKVGVDRVLAADIEPGVADSNDLARRIHPGGDRE